MKTAIVLANLIAAGLCLTPPHITGSKPPVIDCPNSLCYGKYDGNYKINYQPNYFVQCLSRIAHCQACWPMNLVFSGKCNQCLYNEYDDCVTTAKWEPATTYYCPDECPKYGYEFSGNIADSSNNKQYVACWMGVTVGCVACPSGLEFNEEHNACLYEGKYITQLLYDH